MLERRGFEEERRIGEFLGLSFTVSQRPWCLLVQISMQIQAPWCLFFEFSITSGADVRLLQTLSQSPAYPPHLLIAHWVPSMPLVLRFGFGQMGSVMGLGP